MVRIRILKTIKKGVETMIQGHDLDMLKLLRDIKILFWCYKLQNPCLFKIQKV